MSMHVTKKSHSDSNLTELPFNLPGHIFRGKMPWVDELSAWEKKLNHNKVHTVVLLITQQESEFYLELDLGKWYEDHHFKVVYLPIDDFSVPNEQKLNDVLVDVEKQASEGINVVVHCLSGIGRTGLVCSCLAKKVFHYNGEEAIGWVRKSIAKAVESPEQKNFVNAFGEKKVQSVSQKKHIDLTLTKLPFNMPGHIFRGKMPWAQELPAWEDKLKENKVETVVLLMTQQESEIYLNLDLGKWYEDHHFNVVYLPIEDKAVPDEQKLNDVLDEVTKQSQEGKNIVIHCQGGLGRTGLVCSCLAKKIYHYSGDEAIKWVRQSIPTAVVGSFLQKSYVNQFGEKKA